MTPGQRLLLCTREVGWGPCTLTLILSDQEAPSREGLMQGPIDFSLVSESPSHEGLLAESLMCDGSAGQDGRVCLLLFSAQSPEGLLLRHRWPACSITVSQRERAHGYFPAVSELGFLYGASKR